MATKDFDRVAGLLHPEIDFRGLTPNRSWEATGRDAVVDEVFRQWLDHSDHVEEVTSVNTSSFADREHLSYRLRGHNEDGAFAVEQQAYYQVQNGQISWMRVLCSGFRPS